MVTVIDTDDNVGDQADVIYLPNTDSHTTLLEPIAKPRKSFFANDKCHLKGFGGFVIFEHYPEEIESQNDLLTEEDNTAQVLANEGVGVRVRIDELEDESPFYLVLAQVNDVSIGADVEKRITDEQSEYLAFKVQRKGSYIVIDRMNFSGKDVEEGFEFSHNTEIVEEEDEIEFFSGMFLTITYPQNDSQFLTIAINQAEDDEPGALVDSKVFGTGLSGLMNNNEFVAMVMANSDADAILTEAALTGK